MEAIFSLFNHLLSTSGSKGFIAMGILIGFLATRRILQNKNLSSISYFKLIGLLGGVGAGSGLTGYLIENKLFGYLDAYGIGLLVGSIFNIVLRIFAAFLKGISDLFNRVAKRIDEIAGAAIELIKGLFRL